MAKKYLMINGKLILLNDKLIEIPDTASQELVDANYTLVNQNKELVKEIENLLSSRVIGGIEKISASEVQIGEGDFDVVSFDGTYNNKTIEVSGDNNTIYVYDINTVVLDAGESAINGQAINLIRLSGNVTATNLTPENIKKDVSILGVTGTYDNGIYGVEMNVNGLYINNVNDMTPVYINSDVGRIELNSFVDGYLNIGSSANVDIRYEEGATITSPNLNAENIKKDVNILGVKGTFEGGSSGNTLKNILDATKSCYYLFYNYTGTSVDGLIQYSDTENVTKMDRMFYQCSNLQTLPQLDTSNVISMIYMFYQCSKLQTVPQLNTSNVTDISNMFDGCSNLTTIPLLNTSKVTNMYYMFNSCRNLQTIPQLDTSSVTNMSYMFYQCSSLQTIPQLNTSNVTKMEDMFSGCSKLQTVPQLNTSNVTDMNYMFRSCSSLQTIPQLNTSKVTSMMYMFYGCSNLQTLPQLNTSNVAYISNMFYRCSKLQTIDITSLDKVSSSGNMGSFVINCYSLTKLIIRTMTKVPPLDSNSFENCYHFTGTTNTDYNPEGLKDARIYIPDNYVDQLKSATNWSKYADIIVPLSTLVE